MSEAASKSAFFKMPSLSIGAKVLALVGVCLATMALVAGIGIWQMIGIGHEIEDIAERDIPLTEALTKVTIHQLEQSISLERGLRAGAEMATRPEARADLDKWKAKSQVLDKKVETEVLQAKALAETAQNTAYSADARALFRTMVGGLDSVATLHKNVGTLALQVFDLLESNKFNAAIEVIPQLEAQSTKLNTTVETMLLKVEKLTAHAAKVGSPCSFSAPWPPWLSVRANPPPNPPTTPR